MPHNLFVHYKKEKGERMNNENENSIGNNDSTDSYVDV